MQKRDRADARHIYQLSLDNLMAEVGEVSELGIPAVLLFGIPAKKDARRERGLRVREASFRRRFA